MQILYQHHQRRPLPGLRHQQVAQCVEGVDPDGLRVERGKPWVAGRQAERMSQVMCQRHVELERLDLPLDLGPRQLGGIIGGDAAGVAYQLEQRQIGDAGPIGQAPGF